MIVIADTSILLNLCCIRQEHLLYQLMGILGILIVAKREGHIRRVAPIVDQLVNSAGFYLSDPHQTQLLKSCGELPT